jgi:hypothetical protein
LLVAILFLAVVCRAQEKGLMESVNAQNDVPLNTNPTSSFWRRARPIYADVDANGHPVSAYRTQVRSRWTKDNIYFLFICPYKSLYLKPAPDVVHETYELWDWNVAEVFIGSDFQNIKRYKEFELSPHNEWIDLDVNLEKPHHEQGWVWNSGFEHSARIDEKNHLWYAAMRIPFTALDSRPPKAGNTFRVNLFRTEGPPEGQKEEQKEIMWQPTMSQTFHVPERFGLLKLVAK